MLCALSCASGECVLAVYVQCGPLLEQWLTGGSVPIDSHSPDTNTNIIATTSNSNSNGDGDGDGDNESSGGAYGVFSIPASLVDVSIEIFSKICTSPSLSQLNCATHTQTNIVLECLRVLLSPLSASKFCSRRECMQAVNLIFSYYEGEVLDLFSDSDSHTALGPLISGINNSAGSRFSISLAEIVLQSLRACDADPGSMSECAGPIAGLLCHLIINFKDILDIFIINSLLSTTLLCLKNTTSTYVRYSLLMGLIHLFARNATLLANPSSPLLGFLPSNNTESSSSYSNSNGNEGRVNALTYVLEEWCSLHVHLTTRYTGTISTLGLIELIKIFNQHTSNHTYALKVLRLALSTLPRILLSEGAS